MKCLHTIILVLFGLVTSALAQDNELELARQYTQNGEQQKALDIYQKLYKQDNDTYYQQYLNNLISLKKFDEAESITKKMMRKHPGVNDFVVALGSVYRQQGNNDKADALYNDLIKNLPANQNDISILASQFYQNGNPDYAIKIFMQGRKILNNDALFS